MGRLLLDRPNAPERLQEMASQPGMLGVRLTFHRDNDRPMLTNGVADWFWPAAEALSVPVMVHAPERLPQIAEIARRHPTLTLIVDHMGFARETSDDRANAGADRILALAGYPNVSVKVSAAPCYSSEPYPFRNLHEPLRADHRRALACGARSGAAMSRVCSSHCSYRQAVTMFTEELDFLSKSDLEWVMGRGILELLHWE